MTSEANKPKEPKPNKEPKKDPPKYNPKTEGRKTFDSDNSDKRK